VRSEATITHFKNFDRYHSYHSQHSYNFYPEIVGPLTPQLQRSDFKGFVNSGDSVTRIVRTTTALSGMRPKKLISSLSYSKEQLRGMRK